MGQKELVKNLISAVVKNNQQTIMKLVNRISVEDHHEGLKLLGQGSESLQQPPPNDPNARQNQVVSMIDLLKTHKDASNTQLLMVAQQRLRKMSVVSKVLRQNLDGNKGPTHDIEMQTEDFQFIDYDGMSVETGELYMFDRVSKKMRKIIIEKDPETGSKILRVYEYNYKGEKDDFLLQLKSSIQKKQMIEFQYKIEMKNKQYEINRSNRTMKSLMQRICELEGEVYALEEKKVDLINKNLVN